MLDRHGMEILTDAECFDLLQSARLGRVALTHQALPMILPVTFKTFDGRFFFAVAPGVLERGAADGQVVCFEVDWLDEAMEHGWSVVAIGPLSLAQAPVRCDSSAVSSFAPWTIDPHAVVEMSPQLYSGRRLMP